MLSATPMYPIQAPLPVTQNAPALAFMWFLRSFASVSSSTSLPFIVCMSSGAALVCRRCGVLPLGAPSCKTSSQRDFLHGLFGLSHKGLLSCTHLFLSSLPSVRRLCPKSESRLRAVSLFYGEFWLLFGVGFLALLFMKGLPLPNLLDANWTLKSCSYRKTG